MSIMENMESLLVEAEDDKSGDIFKNVGYRAVEAMLKGPGSDEWKFYMSMFARTDAELNRLTLDVNDPLSQVADVRRNVIYLVAYAACGSITLTKLRETVDPVIDLGL